MYSRNGLENIKVYSRNGLENVQPQWLRKLKSVQLCTYIRIHSKELQLHTHTDRPSDVIRMREISAGVPINDPIPPAATPVWVRGGSYEKMGGRGGGRREREGEGGRREREGEGHKWRSQCVESKIMKVHYIQSK